jgi:hypothetical protein
MRLAVSSSVAILALSTAALAQVAAPSGPQTSNNMITVDPNGPDNAATPAPSTESADNMMDDSASPPPTEPK